MEQIQISKSLNNELEDVSGNEAKNAFEEMRRQAKGNSNMTLDEINDEIKLARKELKNEK